MTPAMQKCLEAIERLTVDGVPPTYQQIADDLGYASKSRAWYLVDNLVRRGLVTRAAFRQSGIAVASSKDCESLPLDDMAGAVVRLSLRGKLSFMAVRDVLAKSYAEAVS